MVYVKEKAARDLITSTGRRCPLTDRLEPGMKNHQ